MIRVFPRRTSHSPTDPLAFFGPPGLSRPQDPDTPVAVSVTFSWDKRRGELLAERWKRHYRDVQLGGPAYDSPAQEFVQGRFLHKSITITSRGCVRACSFCSVPKREGRLRELPILPGTRIADNNLLATSKDHQTRVFKMLREQGRAATFSGGLDARLFTDWHVEQLRTVPIRELWFACDSEEGLGPAEAVSKRLEWLPQNKKRCYMLMGFEGDTPEKADARGTALFRMGFLPFAQWFQPLDTVKKEKPPKEARAILRCFARPAWTKAYMKSLRKG